jgi:hypothetical protein
MVTLEQASVQKVMIQIVWRFPLMCAGVRPVPEQPEVFPVRSPLPAI